MANLYVDPINGDNSNLTGSGNPVLNIQRAINEASADDVIILQNTSFNNPARLPFASTKDLTIKSESGQAYVTSSQNASHGSVMEDGLYQFIFTADLQSWVATSSAYQTTVKAYGAGSVKIDASSVAANIKYNHSYWGRKFRLRVVYKTEASSTLKLRIDGSGRGYNFDGTWGTAGTLLSLPNSDAAFTEYTTDWIDGAGDTENGFIYWIMGGTTGVSYIQECHFEVENAWIDNGDGNWYLKNMKPTNNANNYNYSILTTLSGRTPNTALSGLFKGSAGDWSSFRIVETDGAIPGSGDEGYSFFDATTKRLYYRPETGEVVTDLAFEQSHGANCLLITAADVMCSDITFSCNGKAVKTTTSGTSEFHNCVEQLSVIDGVSNDVASNISWYDGASRQPIPAIGAKSQGGGFTCGSGSGTGTGAMLVQGTSVRYAGDDSFQPADSGQMIINGCTSFYPAGCDIEFSVKTSAGALTVNNFSGYGSGLNSFRDQNTVSTGNPAVSLKNASFHSDGTYDMYWTAANESTHTVENVFYGDKGFASPATQTPLAITNDATVLATPPYEDAESGNFTPTKGGVFQGTGSRWWTGANPVGINGEPFSDFDTDIGGVQSTHSPFHPKNL